MAQKMMTQGSYIAEARKKASMSQKELAAKIRHEEDGSAISPQYLNDIERDRRVVTSDHLISQIAQVLHIEADYLHYLAGRLPDEIRRRNLSERDVTHAFRAFRGGPPRR